MKSKRILATLLAVVSMLSLAGCKKEDPNQDPLMAESKETLVAMINEASVNEVAYLEKIQELEDRIRGQVSSSSTTSGIGEIAAGIELTFNTIDGKIVFPNEFNYPGSTQAPNTSSLSVSEAVKLKPTSNWTIKITGSKVELSHSSGISGIMTVGYLDREAQRQQVDLQQHLMDNFFAELPPNEIQFSSLHLDDVPFGVDCASPTTIDEAPAMLRCGMLGYGEISLQYFFVYTGDRDSAKDETILSLMRTLKVWDTELSIVE